MQSNFISQLRSKLFQEWNLTVRAKNAHFFQVWAHWQGRQKKGTHQLCCQVTLITLSAFYLKSIFNFHHWDSSLWHLSREKISILWLTFNALISSGKILILHKNSISFYSHDNRCNQLENKQTKMTFLSITFFVPQISS